MKYSLARCMLFVAFLVLLLAMTISVSAQVQPDSVQANSVEWLTYVDPRFDFSIKYPSNWQVIPRDDSDPNALSGLLVFAPVAVSDNVGSDNGDPHQLGPHI